MNAKSVVFVCFMTMMVLGCKTTPDEGFAPIGTGCKMDPPEKCVGFCDAPGGFVYPDLHGCAGGGSQTLQFRSFLDFSTCNEWRVRLSEVTDTSGDFLITPEQAGVTRTYTPQCGVSPQEEPLDDLELTEGGGC
jgi:hypothetical protein